MKLIKLLSVAFILLMLFSCQSDVIVEDDYPIFSGVNDIYYELYDEIPDVTEGITASDLTDGDLTNDIIFEEDIDFNQIGTYDVEISVQDSDENQITDSFKVIISGNYKPVIFGVHRIYHTVGQQTPNYLTYITAQDDEDGVIDHIQVDDSNVQLDQPGIYPVTYAVVDSYGHQVEETTSVQVTENTETYDLEFLDIYYINDTHGSILENNDEMGLANIGNLILNKYQDSPEETLFLSGGDLLQGNILSNFYYGSSMIDILNEMKLDVFVLGNHEFDWGLDVITEYFNPNTQSTHAKFPLLGANVFYKDTELRPDYVDAYAIFERGDIKIGVVGTIGHGLESSIANSKVADYEFADPIYWTNYYTDILINDFGVDMVIAINHGDDDNYNQQISGNDDIYAVFNGHRHYDAVDLYGGIPVIQSSSNGRYVGHVLFDIDSNNNFDLNLYENINGYDESLLLSPHPDVKTMIDGYVDQIETLLNDAILFSSRSYGRDELTIYMAEIMRNEANADIGFHNYAGTRDSLGDGQAITVATTYKIFPFDNEIISAKLLGSVILDLLRNDSLGYSIRADLNVMDIDPDQYYWVATNSYVFGNYDEFFNYIDVDYTGIVDRVAFEDVLRTISETEEYFILD